MSDKCNKCFNEKCICKAVMRVRVQIQPHKGHTHEATVEIDEALLKAFPISKTRDLEMAFYVAQEIQPFIMQIFESMEE